MDNKINNDGVSKGVNQQNTSPETTRASEPLIADKKYKAFGLEYKLLKTRDGGDLYLTQFGDAFLQCLLPENWHEDSYYARHGQKLPGTSAVYKVPTKPAQGKSIDIVVKFCRIGRDVTPLLTGRSKFISDEEFENARWNGPFEEFGHLMELRKGVYGLKKRFLTQRPLGIFVPPERCQEWQLGRSSDSFRIGQHLMEKDSTLGEDCDPVKLDISRQYIMIFSWIKGIGLDGLLARGALSEERCNEITERVYFQDMIPSGFKVLDTKPAHIILRAGKNNRLLEKDGRYTFALIDYELLRRTDEHEKVYGLSRRSQYWQYIHERFDEKSSIGMPDELKCVSVNGVPYVFGSTPNGGKLWVMGYNYRLFDYFMPEKWRSRDRIRLSSRNEVYHSLTPDNIHLVYKRSRVGILPESNPLEDKPSAIVEQGYNSPFEEVAIAERLRINGLNITPPRAIYRTGQKSTSRKFILDDRRYQAARGLTTPEDPPEPLLSDQHDYYVLWGCWRGIDPEKGYFPGNPHWGFTTVNQALNDKLISPDEASSIMAGTVSKLQRRNIAQMFFGKYDFLLTFNDDMTTLKKDKNGDYVITISVDAYQAYYLKLLDGAQYRALLHETASDLRNLGYEMLNLAGDHLILSINPDGSLMLDEHGRITRSISNFELMRKL